MTALSLAALAVLLSVAAPVALARARALHRAPRAAVVLWQAGALAAVLAAVGAALAAPEEIWRAVRGEQGARDAWLLVAASVAALTAGTIVLRLAVTTLRLGVVLRRRRRRQRDALDLLGAVDDDAARLHVLSGTVPLAYCVPGRPARVVVTEMVLQVLDEAETRAVVEHERAHLRARHDLVLEAFTALHVAFPRVVRSRLALDAVSTLLEMLADDIAAQRTGPGPLRRALRALEPKAEGHEVALRRARLEDVYPDDGPRGHARAVAAGAYLTGAAVLAVPTVALVTPWLRAAVSALTGAPSE
ncbi:Zn-dependent protease with chaperone function [Actinotalea ferrariae CF5-4]|uniref:Zn-dependent protease with chaperone function n=1 Tax=Actinotalea ferrariae CF5-4 TaxID=948458 RepID=A0A021VST1_9CELL|nr:M56 family metallopeptidase [Actinotalea ferrariae]EYR62127.1 Zn-dependent protease with chaperone function [Actinotalea ferrariae CF5-4]